MSKDGYTPRQTASGEFRAYVKDHVALALGVLTIASILVGLVLYVGSKAPASAIVALKESTNKRIDTKIQTAITAHSSVNAHHGVSGMIVRYAPSKVEYIMLKARVDQIERRHSEWRKEIKENLREIKATLRDMSMRLPPRRRRHRRKSP